MISVIYPEDKIAKSWKLRTEVRGKGCRNKLYGGRSKFGKLEKPKQL